MAVATETSSAIQALTPAMLATPVTFISVLNNILQFLASQIASAQGGTGPVTIGDTVTAPNFFAESDEVPTDNDQLLTYGAALKLFGSSNQLVNTALTTNPVPPPQPIPAAPSALIIQEVTAVHGTSTPIPATYAPTIDSLLSVVVAQDSTGGGQITWNALFVNAPVNISILPNTINTFLFFGRNDPVDSTVKWFLLAATLGGTQ